MPIEQNFSLRTHLINWTAFTKNSSTQTPFRKYSFYLKTFVLLKTFLQVFDHLKFIMCNKTRGWLLYVNPNLQWKKYGSHFKKKIEKWKFPFSNPLNTIWKIQEQFSRINHNSNDIKSPDLFVSPIDYDNKNEFLWWVVIIIVIISKNAIIDTIIMKCDNNKKFR